MDENQLRQEIRGPLEAARVRVRAFTGLYADEDLSYDVLLACDAVLALVELTPHLKGLRSTIEERCRRLGEVTSRFSERDLDQIAMARVQALASIDQLQDAVLTLRKSAAHQQRPRQLKRRSM